MSYEENGKMQTVIGMELVMNKEGNAPKRLMANDTRICFPCLERMMLGK